MPDPLDALSASARAQHRLQASRQEIVQALQALNAPADAEGEGQDDHPGWQRWLGLAKALVQHAPWWPTVSRLAEHALAGSPASVGLLLASRSVMSPARRLVRQNPWMVMGAALAVGALVFGQRRRLWRVGLAFAVPRVLAKARQVGHMLASEALSRWFARTDSPRTEPPRA